MLLSRPIPAICPGCFQEIVTAICDYEKPRIVRCGRCSEPLAELLRGDDVIDQFRVPISQLLKDEDEGE